MKTRVPEARLNRLLFIVIATLAAACASEPVKEGGHSESEATARPRKLLEQPLVLGSINNLIADPEMRVGSDVGALVTLGDPAGAVSARGVRRDITPVGAIGPVLEIRATASGPVTLQLAAGAAGAGPFVASVWLGSAGESEVEARASVAGSSREHVLVRGERRTIDGRVWQELRGRIVESLGGSAALLVTTGSATSVSVFVAAPELRLADRGADAQIPALPVSTHGGGVPFRRPLTPFAPAADRDGVGVGADRHVVPAFMYAPPRGAEPGRATEPR